MFHVVQKQEGGCLLCKMKGRRPAGAVEAYGADGGRPAGAVEAWSRWREAHGSPAKGMHMAQTCKIELPQQLQWNILWSLLNLHCCAQTKSDLKDVLKAGGPSRPYVVGVKQGQKGSDASCKH